MYEVVNDNFMKINILLTYELGHEPLTELSEIQFELFNRPSLLNNHTAYSIYSIQHLMSDK